MLVVSSKIDDNFLLVCCTNTCLIIVVCIFQVRAANLSGDCFFSKENFGRLRFGWRKHQQVNYCSVVEPVL